MTRREISRPGHDSPSKTFRPDIEGLRGIAILLVMAYHVGFPGFSGGFVGVDVFYVLSGYLITSLLLREIEQNGRLDVAGFYARRARRLLPAAALVLLATVVVGSFVYSPLEQKVFSRTALATALYMSNIWFIRQSVDYFAPATGTNPLLHTWSLGVEEQFYLVWPVIVFLALRRRRSRRVLVAVLVALTLLSFAAYVWLMSLNPPWAFFGLPTRAWELGVGGLASLLPAATLEGRRDLIRGLAWLGLFAIVGAALAFSGPKPFPGAVAVPAVVGAAAVLICGVETPGLHVGRMLGAAPLRLLGQLSYSWYLWHWPVLTMAKAILPTLWLSGRLLCAVTSLGLAAATYVLVENPIRFNHFLVRRSTVSLGLAFAITVGGVGIASVWHRVALGNAESPQQMAFSRAATENSRLSDDGCMVGYLDERPRECVFGDSASGSTVVLFGDSHAAQWFPALERIALERGWRLVTMIKAECPVASVLIFSSVLQREYVECWRWREAALKRIAATHPAAVVASSSIGYVRGVGRGERSPREWRDGNRQTLAALDAAGVRTLLLRDVPRPGFDIPSCLARAAWRSAHIEDACVFPRSAAVDETVFQAEQEAAEGLSHISLMDFSDQFCGAELCEPMRNGIVVYRDENHLTVAFSESLSKVLAGRIASLISPTGR